MNLRKCQALNTTGDNPIEFEGYFHRWHVVDGEIFSLIEDASGNIRVWDTNIQFLEPARQRVEVTPYDGPVKTGHLVGWFQRQDNDEAWPVAVVKCDDGTFGEYEAHRVRIIKEVPND